MDRNQSIQIVNKGLFPAATKAKLDLENGLKKSERHRRNCLVIKTLATAIEFVGTVITLTTLALSPVIEGSLTIIAANLGLVITLLSLLIYHGVTAFDEQIIRESDTAKLLQIQQHYETTKSLCLDFVSDEIEQLL